MARSSTLRVMARVTALLALLAGCKGHDRPNDTLTCTVGENLTVGCTGTVGTVCSGDPVLNICDGTVMPNTCADTNAIAHNDDSMLPGATLCPLATTVCPASGRVTIATHPLTTGNVYHCPWDIVHGGLPPGTDAGTGGGGG